jgi:hypothetical protein
MNVSSFATFLLVNTYTAAGSVQLPPIQSNIGRSLLIKDQYANFDRSTCTLQAHSGDSFDTGGSTRILRVKGEMLELIAGNDSKWHTLEDSYSQSQIYIQHQSALMSTLTFKAPTIVAPSQSRIQTIQF